MSTTLSHNNFWKYLFFVGVATLWITITVIFPEFLGYPVAGIREIIVVGMYIVATSILSFFLLFIAGLNKYVAAVFYPVYTVLGSAVSYYRLKYHVTITPLILDCILHTNAEEALGVIAWQMICWVLFNASIGIGFVVWRWRLQPLKRTWLFALAATVLLCGYYTCSNRLRHSLNHRYPMDIIESFREYHAIQQARNQKHCLPDYTVGEPIPALDIVVIIGESLRADHLQLNKYARSTNPRLSQRKNVVSYPHIYSQYTHTLASVPVILTRADSVHPEYQYTETSFAAIMRKEGYHCVWISNQDLGETFMSFPAECDTCYWVNAGKSPFVFSGWYDEDMLPAFDEQLGNRNHKLNLIILHSVGSHWYYNSHVPETHYHFLPITDSKVVTNNTLQQVLNSYDNTVRYADFFLDSIIQRLVDRCSIVVYLSDHGESLGENGNWLHADGGAEETKNPACIIWYSDTFADLFPQKTQALRANAPRRYRTDFLYHTILDAANISITDTCIDISQYNLFHFIDNNGNLTTKEAHPLD